MEVEHEVNVFSKGMGVLKKRHSLRVKSLKVVTFLVKKVFSGEK